MNMVSPVIAQKIVFGLGIVNVVAVLLLLSGCRCVVGSKMGAALMKHPWFKRYSKFHCYLWWILWPSVIVHAFFGISLLGIPR